MRTAAKVLLVMGLTLMVLLVGSGMLLAAAVAHSGLVTVKVHEAGNHGATHLHLPIPAALVYLGMDLMPLVTDEDVMAEARTELGEWGPAAAEALRALEDAPDAVLVDVQSADESVRITKEGRVLAIHIDGPDGTFEISLPAGLLGRIAREIA